MLSVTILILLITCIISFTAFSNEKVINDFIFYPPAISNRNQWYRFITCGFIHADLMHLAFNMYTLYLFGDKVVEPSFEQVFDSGSHIFFALLYITALVVCLLPTYFAHKDNYYYRSLGASGAVSAVVFAGILLYPTMGMGIFPIPINIPAFIFGPLYLIISAILAKRGQGNINHSAHIWGAVYGVVFVAVVCQFLTPFRPLSHFITEVMNYLKI